MNDTRRPVILNVDDTATSRLVTTLILRKAGFDVVEAATGTEALKRVDALPDLVLLDVNLPDVNGFEICRRIKTNARTKAIPIVHLSAAHVTPEDRVTGLEEGADGYLIHPVDPRELVATINAFLRLKRVEHALLESERWHRALFEHAHEALITLAPPTWQFTSGNPAALVMFGIHDTLEFPPAALWDHSPERQPDGRPSQERARELIEVAVKSGSVIYDWTYRRVSGETFPVSVLLTRIDGEDGPLLLATLRDESEKKRLEASVAQSDRLASMGVLAASMAHELNNPLAYVHYNVESLAEDLPVIAAAIERCCEVLRGQVGQAEFSALVGEAATVLDHSMLRDVVDRIQETLVGTSRMKAMTRGLGMFSRLEQGERASCDILAALESAIHLSSNEIAQKAQLVRDLASVSRVRASEGKLSQVFLNLLVNAAHAIDDGDAYNNKIVVRSWAEDAMVCVEVADTGRGIAPEHLERIFEPFFTTKPAGLGTGLGLAICRGIVAEFGGELSVESQLGCGTRFVLRLPMESDGHRDCGEGLRTDMVSVFPREKSAVRGRVLVVDDEESLRVSMRRLLGRDHEVVTLGSGEQAQALLEEDPAFDAIVCDLMMSGMPGMALHAWLETRDPWLAKQVLFVTGGAFTPRASEYLAKVDNITLDKPFDGHELRRIVTELVRNAKSRG